VNISYSKNTSDGFYKRAVEALVPLLRPFDEMRERRRAARKPCAWCTDSFKRPAVYIVKWRRSVIWEDEFNDGSGLWVTPAGKRMIMCEFHSERATRYPGVSRYRFRR